MRLPVEEGENGRAGGSESDIAIHEHDVFARRLNLTHILPQPFFVMATQNPVDLDYKGLSNAGTWFLGRLQTERDKARVLDGLVGAADAQGGGFNRKEISQIHRTIEDNQSKFMEAWNDYFGS